MRAAVELGSSQTSGLLLPWPILVTSSRLSRGAEVHRVMRRGALPAAVFHRQFSATAQQSKDHHFDTLKFVQRLKDEGFTEEQAEGMMKVLSDVIEER